MIKESQAVFFKLQAAAREAQRREMLALQTEFIEPHVFSDEFNRKMKHLFRTNGRSHFRFVNTIGRRVAVIALVLIAALTVTTASVKALREPFIEFIVSVYERFTSVILQTDNAQSDSPLEIEEMFLPQYLPENYVLLESNNYLVMAITTYSDGRDELIFEQHIMNPTHFNVDTEDVELENIVVNDIEVLFYSNKGFNNILWTDGLYAYKVMGIIDKNKLLNLLDLENITKE
jgi:hypothetical protein